MRKDSRAIVFLEEQFSKVVKGVGAIVLNLFQPFLQIP